MSLPSKGNGRAIETRAPDPRRSFNTLSNMAL
jgi:hypothetical protein